MTDLDRLREKRRAKAAKLKSPKPIELPSGAWRCQVMVQGKRISVVDEDPEVAHTKALAVKNGLIEQKKAPAALTVGEVIDRYIESKDAVLSPSTVNGYKKMRKSALQDIMGENAATLTQERVQKAVNRMAREKSPKYVRNAYGLFTAAMGVYMPERTFRVRLPQKRAPEIRIPTMEEIGRIYEDCKGTRFELPFLLAVWLGLRTSEIRGLTWDCIDGDVLTIKQALVDGEDGPVLKTTKTYSGNRRLKIPPYIKALLDREPHNGEYIVTYTRNAMYNRLRLTCSRLGIKRFRFHDLRHVNASVMLSLNVPDKYAMERMGHATNNMLKTVYQHTMSQKAEQVAEMVDTFFEENLHTNLHTPG